MAESVLMATFEFFMVRQILTYLGENKITKIGCRWLSKANWKKLSCINLGNI
jgi:hypothetical protein